LTDFQKRQTDHCLLAGNPDAVVAIEAIGRLLANNRQIRGTHVVISEKAGTRQFITKGIDK